MAITKKNKEQATASKYTIPKAPFIYINDPSIDCTFVTRLGQLIPKTTHVVLAQCPEHSEAYLSTLKTDTYRDTVYLFADKRPDHDEKPKKTIAGLIRETAIRVGCNFASVNLYFDDNAETTNWGANHLDLAITDNEEYATAQGVQMVAEKIYQWLFTVLTVKDTLHLIPDEEMQKIETIPEFKDYEYCPIGECSRVPKDAKVQFVALIVERPSIIEKNKITWQVADKTGTANFFFRYRDAECKPTWDWIMRLEPGQRKSLPRMPSVLIQENLLMTVVKAPARIPGSVIEGTGETFQCFGRVLVKIGKIMKMGQRKRWIAQADAAGYLKKNDKLRIVPSEGKSTIPVFTKLGRKTWSDTDSSGSTLQGDDHEKETGRSDRNSKNVLQEDGNLKFADPNEKKDLGLVVNDLTKILAQANGALKL